MAKIRLDLDDLSVESFEVVSGAGGNGSIHGYALGEDAEYGSYSCAGTCKSCATGPCDAMCTGPASCMCDGDGDQVGVLTNEANPYQ